LTAEQLEASRAERMRQNGNGALTLEDARTWIEETGLCLFLPRRQFSSSIAPSFVEAVAGQQNATPDPRHIALAEELLVRLETDGVAVRLNLLGHPGEQPDYVVAGWVLPYVYALRGDRDWRRSPQLTGSRQVSQLAVQAYKQLEAGETAISALTHALGREVTEAAVLRAITELWQQLRIIPVVSAVGQPAQWQLLRTRFQKAIAEGASTSQVTAISVLASIYLQAVIAASMEEVELFLAPLTARSKIREVLRGLVATRQVHTISMGHAPHFYVAGTLPEFAVAPTIYSSSSMPASAYFLRSWDHEEESLEIEAPIPVAQVTPAAEEAHKPDEPRAPRPLAPRKPVASGKSAAARTHFSRPAAHSRDRKPAQSSNGGRTSARPARRASSETRPSTARPAGTRTASGSRPPAGARWSQNAAKSTAAARTGSGSSKGTGSSSSSARSSGSAARPARTGTASRTAKSAVAPAWGQRNGHGKSAKPAAKPNATTRTQARPDARNGRGSRKPALTAGAKAGSSNRYGFTNPSKPKSEQETKKRA
jgi:23S rRNA pseudouridine2605 synthase